MTKAEVAAGTQPGGKSPASKPSANPVRAISTADKKTKPKPAAKAPAVKAPVSGTGTGRGGDLAQAPPLSRDWSEALDLPEPSLEDVEQQIQAALERELRPAGQEMTEALVLQLHAPDEQDVSCPVARGAFLARLTHLRMHRQHLNCLGPALPSALPSLTHVYLQHNQLQSLQPLAGLRHLQFACLSYNRIEQAEGVSELSSLMFLDLSHNLIQDLDPAQLPQSLRFLKVEGNPCTSSHAARTTTHSVILHHLPALRDLDGPVTHTNNTNHQTNSDTEVTDSAAHDSDDNNSDRNSDTAEGGDNLASSQTIGMRLRAAQPGLQESSARAQGQSNIAGDGGLNGETGVLGSAYDVLDSLERSCCDASMSALAASVTALGLNTTRTTQPPTPASQTTPEPSSIPSALASASSSSGTTLSRQGSVAQSLSRAASASRGGLDRPLQPRPSLTRALGAKTGTQLPPPPPALSGIDRSSTSLTGPAQTGSEAGQASAATGTLEQQIQEDLEGLRSQLQTFMEPLTAAAAAVVSKTQGLDSGERGGRRKTGSRPVSAVGAVKPGTAPVWSDDSVATEARKGLHGELDKLMGAAAARIAAQRAVDAGLSQDIRALRGSTHLLAELRASLNLRAAVAAGPGAVAAVRDAVRQARGAPGAVQSALDKYATQRALDTTDQAQSATNPTSGPGKPDRTSNLRNSLARLEQLSVSLLAEHGADIDELTRLTHATPSSTSRPTSATPATHSQQGADTATTAAAHSQAGRAAGSKYQAVIAAKAGGFLATVDKRILSVTEECEEDDVSSVTESEASGNDSLSESGMEGSLHTGQGSHTYTGGTMAAQDSMRQVDGAPSQGDLAIGSGEASGAHAGPAKSMSTIAALGANGSSYARIISKAELTRKADIAA